ncbi:MAG: LytR/AlgR family response regulator transcription factor [Flammeovirgaceae bacterium]
MTSIKSIIIDDEPFARKLIIDYSKKISRLEILKDFSNALEALNFIQHNQLDLIFLDIKMPGIDGLNFLKSLSNPPKVIFTTAFSEYALDGFELDAIDYLLKPFDFPRFLKAYNKAQLFLSKTSHPKQAQHHLFVKDGYSIVKVAIDDLLYIQGQKDYVMLHLIDRKIMTRKNMKDLEDELADFAYLRIHNSYIVNTKHIEAINHESVIIHGVALPVSLSYRQRVKLFAEQFFSS